eukprot:scaffold119949_cov39-Prasinocladus_malaysianus.AAC.1
MSIRVGGGLQAPTISMRRLGNSRTLSLADKHAAERHAATGNQYPVLSKFLDIDEGVVDHETNTVSHTLL